MAVPEGVTPVYNNIVVSVYGFRSGFGIKGGTQNALVGSVYKIGSNVYNISVNTKVGFLRTEAFFATDSGDTFITIDKDDVLITYVEPML
jgi:hypothetical protein